MESLDIIIVKNWGILLKDVIVRFFEPKLLLNELDYINDWFNYQVLLLGTLFISILVVLFLLW